MKDCLNCGASFEPDPRSAGRAKFCPGGKCRREYEQRHRRVVAPPGQGRKRPKRLEVGAGIVRAAAEALHEWEQCEGEWTPLGSGPSPERLRATILEALVEMAASRRSRLTKARAADQRVA